MPSEKCDENEDSGFAPHNPTDGRVQGEWESRYRDSEAIKEIRIETFVLVSLLLLCPSVTFLTWHGIFQDWLTLNENQYSYLKPFIYGSLGGLLGGTLFSIKWLYHSVAKGIWNLDRRLWRMLTPLLSMGLAFAVIVFVRSGLFSAFNAEALNSGALSFSIGFLVGYFSDSAIAKLAEIAQTLFGTASKKTHQTETSGEDKISGKN